MRVLLTGAGGFIGSHILRVLRSEPAVRLFSSQGKDGGHVEIDLDTPGAIASLVATIRPELIIHTAAITSIAECDANPTRAMRVNGFSVDELADAASKAGARVLLFSTDQVFDGEQAPYDVDAETRALHVYGHSKEHAEEAVLGLGTNGLILRPSLVLGRSPVGNRTPEEILSQAAATSGSLKLFHDEIRSPVHVEDIADLVRNLTQSWHSGILHAGGIEPLSRFELGKRICRSLELPRKTVTRVGRESLSRPDERPRDLTLLSHRTWKARGISPVVRYK